MVRRNQLCSAPCWPLLCSKKLFGRSVRRRPVTVSHTTFAAPFLWSEKSFVTGKSLYIPFTLNGDWQTIYLQPVLLLLCESEGPVGHQHREDYCCPSKLDCRICTSWHLLKDGRQLPTSCPRLWPTTQRVTLVGLFSHWHFFFPVSNKIIYISSCC